eukprot:gene10792-16938_t
MDQYLESLATSILNATNPYDVLMLDQVGCSIEAVKASYKKLALTFHPDKCRCSRASAVFADVSAAFQQLQGGWCGSNAYPGKTAAANKWSAWADDLSSAPPSTSGQQQPATANMHHFATSSSFGHQQPATANMHATSSNVGHQQPATANTNAAGPRPSSWSSTHGPKPQARVYKPPSGSTCPAQSITGPKMLSAAPQKGQEDPSGQVDVFVQSPPTILNPIPKAKCRWGKPTAEVRLAVHPSVPSAVSTTSLPSAVQSAVPAGQVLASNRMRTKKVRKGVSSGTDSQDDTRPHNTNYIRFETNSHFNAKGLSRRGSAACSEINTELHVGSPAHDSLDPSSDVERGPGPHILDRTRLTDPALSGMDGTSSQGGGSGPCPIGPPCTAGRAGLDEVPTARLSAGCFYSGQAVHVPLKSRGATWGKGWAKTPMTHTPGGSLKGGANSVLGVLLGSTLKRDDPIHTEKGLGQGLTMPIPGPHAEPAHNPGPSPLAVSDDDLARGSPSGDDISNVTTSCCSDEISCSETEASSDDRSEADCEFGCESGREDTCEDLPLGYRAKPPLVFVDNPLEDLAHEHADLPSYMYRSSTEHVTELCSTSGRGSGCAPRGGPAQRQPGRGRVWGAAGPTSKKGGLGRKQPDLGKQWEAPAAQGRPQQDTAVHHIKKQQKRQMAVQQEQNQLNMDSASPHQQKQQKEEHGVMCAARDVGSGHDVMCAARYVGSEQDDQADHSLAIPDHGWMGPDHGLGIPDQGLGMSAYSKCERGVEGLGEGLWQDQGVAEDNLDNSVDCFGDESGHAWEYSRDHPIFGFDPSKPEGVLTPEQRADAGGPTNKERYTLTAGTCCTTSPPRTVPHKRCCTVRNSVQTAGTETADVAAAEQTRNMGPDPIASSSSVLQDFLKQVHAAGEDRLQVEAAEQLRSARAHAMKGRPFGRRKGSGSGKRTLEASESKQGRKGSRGGGRGGAASKSSCKGGGGGASLVSTKVSDFFKSVVKP